MMRRNYAKVELLYHISLQCYRSIYTCYLSCYVDLLYVIDDAIVSSFCLVLCTMSL